jgi:hypothetical protein
MASGGGLVGVSLKRTGVLDLERGLHQDEARDKRNLTRALEQP